MISLQVCVVNTETDTYFLKNQDRLIALEVQPSVRHLLRNDEHIVGIEEHYHHDGAVESAFLLTEKVSEQDFIDLIAILLESYICRYHVLELYFIRKMHN